MTGQGGGTGDVLYEKHYPEPTPDLTEEQVIEELAIRIAERHGVTFSALSAPNKTYFREVALDDINFLRRNGYRSPSVIRAVVDDIHKHYHDLIIPGRIKIAERAAMERERKSIGTELEIWMQEEASPYRKIAQAEHAILKLKEGKALKSELLGEQGKCPKGGEHEWIDATNEVVKSGEICKKCLTIRAAHQSSLK